MSAGKDYFFDDITGNATQSAKDFIDNLIADRNEQRDIVARIWRQLGSPSYEQLAGRSIHDIIDERAAVVDELAVALAGVVAVADRNTPEFRRAHAALARAGRK